MFAKKFLSSLAWVLFNFWLSASCLVIGIGFVFGSWVTFQLKTLNYPMDFKLKWAD